MKLKRDKHLVLWDGECGFCRRSIKWVVRHDGGEELECMSYQQAPPPLVSEELRRACAEAVHVITKDGTVLRGARAWLFMLRALGWRRWATVLGTPPFVWIVELGYRLVARNRQRLSRMLSP